MKKIIGLSLGLILLGAVTALAQNFACTTGSPVRVQFTGCGSTPTWTDNSTSAVALRTISAAGTYTVNCGGTLYSFRITNINACPTFVCDLNVNSSNVITSGQSSTLSYTGCSGGTVSWDQGLGTGNNKTVSPSATTTYNATCTPANGLICTRPVTVQFVDCSITANASPSTATPSQSVTLSYTGCAGGSVDWVNGNDEGVGSGNNIVVNPSSTTTYTAACHKEGGYCLSSVTVTVSTCSVSASASPNTINAGQSSILSYTGCPGGSVSWDNGAGNGNNRSVSPSSTTTYTATCTPNGGGAACTASVTVNVTSCTITASASPTNINAGQSSTLSYTGCINGTINWDNGAGTGNNITVTPTVTTTYTANCTPRGGGTICTSSVTVNVTSCTITASASPNNITAGQSSTLSYTGCSNGSVSWNNGAGNGNNRSVNPGVTTTYTATCTPTGGGSVCTSAVTVNVSSCNITASASPTNINAGQNTTLSYTGCSGGSVNWNNGAGNGNNRSVSPNATTTYTATCTPSGGGATCTPSGGGATCSSSVTVNVTPCSVLAFAQNSTINAGQSTLLAYENCTNGSVSWDNGLGTGNNKTITPAVTTTYVATCTPTGGGSVCTSSVTVNVNVCSITASASPNNITAGQNSTLSYTGCSNGSVSWNNGAGNGNNRSVNPGVTTTYTATCTPTGGGSVCTSAVTVNVSSCNITASASPTNINAGQITTLSYTGCTGGSVNWNNGAGNGNNRSVSPLTTTTYTATCTPSGGGATCSSSVTVNVTPCSVLAFAQNSTINAGQSTVLAYENCTNGSVSWDNGLGMGNNKTITPATTTTYVATCTPTGGGSTCTSSVTVNVTNCSITASASPTNINAGQSSTLSYTGCTGGTVSWNNGAGNGNNRVVTPGVTTTYTATCTPSGGGSVCTSAVTVNVSSCNITASANPMNINAGQSSTLSYTGCSNGSVSWDNGAGNGNNVLVSPASTTTYTATCTPNGGGSPCNSTVIITVNCILTTSASPNNINAGQSSTLTYTGCPAGTVSWDNSVGSGNNQVVSPATTTTYTATCTPNGGGAPCTSSVTVNVTSCTVTASASPASINAGQNSTLSYTGCTGGTANWDNGLGSGNNKTVAPTTTTTYTVTCTPNGGGAPCTASVTINVVSCAISAAASPNNINSGQSSTLTYTGCANGTVIWDNGLGTGNNKIVSPSTNTTYTATCTPNGGGAVCTSSVTVNVTSCTLTASVSPNNINAGQSSTLSYTGCAGGSVSWDNGAGNGNNITVTPSVTTTYTATCTPNGGGAVCTSSVTVNVTSCTLTASASPNNINAGQSSTLSYTGCAGGSVSWDNGAGNGNNITVTPSATTTYTATCTPNGGGVVCTSSVTVNVTSCTLTASASPNNINAGQSSTLSYTGCAGGSVSWDNGAGNGNNITVTPSVTTTYTATCTPNGGGAVCTSSVTVNVTSCTLTASASPNNINAGQNSTLSYTGCAGGSVSWDNGAGNGNNRVVSPSATTTYTATCTPNGGGAVCTSSVTVNVTSCTITASASPNNINAGQSAILSYSGCIGGSVSWDNGAGTGNNRVVSPSTTTTYTATCTPNGGGAPCTSSVTVNVTSCTLTASASPNNINAGQSSTLSYTGCAGGSVSWDNGAGNGNNISVNPSVTTNYTATCTPNGGGAVCTSSVTVNVTSCTLTASASPNNINAGQSSTLSYTGCAGGGVSWDNGAGNGNNISVNPSVTTNYTATCTPNGGGAPCTSSVTVNVTSCTLTASASPNNINAGQSSTLSYTGCAGGSVSWDNGAGNGNNISVNPSVTTTYTATCTPNGGGAVCTSSVTVNVTSCTLTASASPNNINAGQSSTLSYTGCAGGSVSWDNGAGNGNNITVTPSVTTTYTATCTPNGGGAICTSSVTVNVTSCTLTASASPNNINAGQSSTLSYTGCTGGSVSWDNGAGNGNNRVVSPSATTTYTAICTPNGGGAVCTSSVTVNVTSCTLTASASPNNINAGQSSTLSYIGCIGGSVSWDNGAGNGNNISVTPSATTTYTATCTPNGGGAVCTSSVTVNVTSCTLTASASPNNINAGQSSTLSYTGCAGGSVSWDNGAGTRNNISVNPSSTITYTATCTPNGGGVVCTSSVTVNVTGCNLTASVSLPNINAGQSVTLSYTGCSNGTVSWSNGAGNGNNLIVNPASTTTYTATCNPNGGGAVCTSSVTVNVTSCNLTAAVSATNINAGQSVTLTYTGCSNGTVNWSNGAGTGTGNNISVNPSGTTTFTATCTPSGGGSVCTASVTVNVIACNLSASASSTNLNEGQSTTLFYGGCTNGTITWDNGAGNGNNRAVSPALTTTYTATCTPGGGGNTCSASVTVNVIPCTISTLAAPPGINVGQSTVLSYTGCGNGSVSWNNGAGNGNNRTVTPVFTTTYTATCTPTGGGNACTAEVTVTVSPAPISITSSGPKAPSCTDGKNGSITLNLSRSIVPGETNIRLTLFKNNTAVGTYLTQNALFTTLENLEAGTYQVVIETLIGTIVSARAEGSVTLINPPPVVFSLSKTDIKCFGGSDGTIQIEAEGGTGTFFYQLNAGNPTAFNGGAKHSLTNVGLATYTLRVSDNFNCTAPTQTITVSQPAARVELTKISQKDPRGFETKDGQGVVRVKGGTSGYVFEWTDEKGVSYGTGVTTLPDNSNNTLRGGTYFARVYDANYAAATQKAGCFSEVSFMLTEPPIIEASIETAKEISCFGKKDGTLLVTPKGGVPLASGYTLQLYSKTNATLVYLPNKTSFEKLPAGQYTLTVTDANEVSRSFNYTLTEPLKVVAKLVSMTQPTCFGDKTGSIEISAGGGRGTYSTTWSNSAKGMKLNNLSAGKFTAVVTDFRGCQSDIVSVEIKEPPRLDIAFKLTQPTCSYSCNGSVVAAVTGGTGAYQMSWEGRNDKDTKIDNLCGNELLTFKVSDANQCITTKTALLLRPAPIASKVESEKKLCQGQSILLDGTHEQADSYLWKLPDGTTSTQPIIETKQVGSYSLSLFDKTKCEFKSTVNVTQAATNGKIRFASASTAPRNEPVVVLNLSDPAPTKVDWILPKEAVVTSKTNERVEFKISTLGDYTIGIKANFAACELYQAKQLSIVEFYPKTIAVTNDEVVLKVSPNPSFDDIDIHLKFDNPVSFKLRLFEAAHPERIVFETEKKDQTEFRKKISASLLNSGMYILSVDTPKNRITQKVTVLK